MMKMDIREIAEGVSVAGQLDPQDVAAIAALGFKTILCNRPDNEAAGQPSQEVIKQEALKAGLTFDYNPVSSHGMTQANVDQMAQILETVAKPILAYCRSGARSTNLYQIALSK
jgi:uncharacterized protein (TIGR01244 family)